MTYVEINADGSSRTVDDRAPIDTIDTIAWHAVLRLAMGDMVARRSVDFTLHEDFLQALRPSRDKPCHVSDLDRPSIAAAVEAYFARAPGIVMDGLPVTVKVDSVVYRMGTSVIGLLDGPGAERMRTLLEPKAYAWVASVDKWVSQIVADALLDCRFSSTPRSHWATVRDAGGGYHPLLEVRVDKFSVVGKLRIDMAVDGEPPNFSLPSGPPPSIWLDVTSVAGHLDGSSVMCPCMDADGPSSRAVLTDVLAGIQQLVRAVLVPYIEAASRT